jgi:hypothetical protein
VLHPATVRWWRERDVRPLAELSARCAACGTWTPTARLRTSSLPWGLYETGDSALD